MSASTSNLASVVTDGSPPQIDPGTMAASANPPAPMPVQPQQPKLAPQPSRFLSTLASIVSAGMAGIPDKGRSSFVTGLGEGARSAQAAEANQAAIKFANFNDSVRIANLHAQDLHKQQTDAAQQSAQQAAEDFQREAFENHGGSYDTHPNNGTAVTQTLQAQTAANGSASIAPGTHISANGKDILIPSNSPDSLASQVRNYKSLEGVLPGLPSLPAFDPSSVKTTADVAQARQDLGKHLDIMQHLLQGYDIGGNPQSHERLNDLIPAYQAQIDSLSKNNGATPYQMGTLKNTLAILQANEKNHQDFEDQAFAKQTDKQVDRATKLGAVKTANQEAVQDNAAGNKTTKPDTNMYVGTDATGNQIAGTSDDLKTAGAQSVTKLDSDTGKKVTQAREMISPDGLFSSVSRDIQNLQAKGKLGVAASRWNEFMGGTVGTDPDFAPLRTDMGLLATKLMQVHVGARGSAEMLHHFANLADYKISDTQTLTEALKAEYRYIHGAAMLPKKAGQ